MSLEFQNCVHRTGNAVFNSHRIVMLFMLITDVVGIITNVEPVSETSKGILKRELVITDSSKTEISVFFWKTDVELCDTVKELSPIILRGATKKAFGDEAVLWYSWKTRILVSNQRLKFY